MPTSHLDQRAIIEVTGAEAESFLQNVITTDLAALGTKEAKPGALLTPQGKILFDFLISRAGAEALRLECRAEIADDFVKRLMLYRLRAKAEITKQEQSVVGVSWGDDSASSETDSSVRDGRFQTGIKVQRHYGKLPTASTDNAQWHALRIAHGVAESGNDFQLSDAFPHDVLLDQNGGVGLKKGCYVGQEVVSRMHHRGTARRRLLIVKGADNLPSAGTEITAGGRAIGALGSTQGNDGLAIARIDRVKQAQDADTPIIAGDVVLELTIPEWAHFTFPDDHGDKETA